MVDLSKFAGLDREYTLIIESWVESIQSEFESVLQWWENLCDKLDVGKEEVSRVHWPAGPCSHPRMIALFRQHYFMIYQLNVQRARDMPFSKAKESDWGTDDDEEMSGPFSPQELLIDMMESYAPDLWAYFRLFVFIPVGEDENLEIC